MRSYQFIIVRDDGQQKKLSVTWDTSLVPDRVNVDVDIAKHLGYEIQEAIRRWEEE